MYKNHIIKDKYQIQAIKDSAKIAAKALQDLKQFIKPGISTKDIDMFCNNIFKQNNAVSGCIGYEQFPENICTSVNTDICHGVPNDRPLKDGDIVTVDIVVKKDGYYSDTAYTYGVGTINQDNKQLILGAATAMYAGIANIKPGEKLLSIAKGINECIKKFNGLHVMPEFCGHGVGLELHEPMLVLNTLPTSQREIDMCNVLMEAGMIFTVEPIITIGKTKVTLSKDRFTYQGSCNAAMFEHTVLVTENGYEILTKRENEDQYILDTNKYIK